MGYKAYSDSYLMSLTKAQIIELLRVAEHNFFATEEGLQNSARFGAEVLAENAELKKLLKAAVEDLRLVRKCQYCKHQITGYADICYGCHVNTNKWEWRYADEALKLIGGSENG